MAATRFPASLFRGLGRNVIVLGFVSLFTDISSEMLYPVIPLFLTVVLHAPMQVIGIIEGAAESTASLLKFFSGYWSDKIKRQVPFVVAGYSTSAIAKPLFYLAASWHLVLGARLLDRLGKGIRTSPRDALIAASCDPANRGKAYGLHRAMDSTGAVIGPLIAIWFFSRFGHGESDANAYRMLFLLAFLPAVLGVLCFAFLKSPGKVEVKKSKGGHNPLSGDLWKFLVVIGLFSLGNSSDVFLLLRAKDMGFSPITVLWIYVVYNFVYAAASGPLGALSDRLSRRAVLTGGFLVFALVYGGFALKPSPVWIWLLFAVYGLYAAANEGVAKAYIADLSVSENRGTAMGAYQLTIGLLAFVASAVAGFLWDQVGSAAPFVYGAACSLGAAILFFVLLPGRNSSAPARQS